MNLDLINKNALVCGSTQGIGKAIALQLAEMGANVTLIARNETALKSVLQELDSKKKQQHSYLCVDFSNPNELKEKINSFANKNAIHILINNTGGPAGGPVLTAKPEEFIQAFSNHLICNQLLVQAFADGMKKANYGRIINIISTSVKQPIKGLGVSNTIRAAVANWAKTLSMELAPFGITVNNVLPGATKTIRLEAILENKSKKTGASIEKAADEMLSEIPAGRFA